MSDEPRGRLRRVGAMWKPRPGSKSLGSGSMTVNGLKQRFVLLSNDRKQGDRDPDYVLMSGDEPEVDEYAQRSAAASTPSTAADQPVERFVDPVSALRRRLDDDIPF